jgi:hypothetical protein
MNEHANAGRDRQRPEFRCAGVLAAVVAGAAFLVTACSGGGGSSSPAVAGSTAFQNALAYAHCMRSHGEPGFPDPDSKGNFLNLGPVNIDSPQYLSANRTCGHLLPSYQVTPAQRQQELSSALRYSVCMRSHGVPSFPDPVELANGNIELRLGAGHGGSPQQQAAAQACRKFLPGGGP